MHKASLHAQRFSWFIKIIALISQKAHKYTLFYLLPFSCQEAYRLDCVFVEHTNFVAFVTIIVYMNRIQPLRIKMPYQACHGYMSAGRPPYLCHISGLSGYNTS